jgi:hypothetical protein
MKESADVIALREKLKAIETQRKRDVAIAIVNKYFEYALTEPVFDRVIDAMIEFNDVMKKTGI